MYRTDILLKENRQIFSTRDLALLWQISNDNTLYTTVKRYLQKGILVPIQKGLYATVPLEKIDPIFLGTSFLKTYCYLTCEYVLSLNGLIFQPLDQITFVSTVSKKFKIAGHSYFSRKMADRYLFNETGLITKNGLKIASSERAAADMLYFRPGFHFDNKLSLDMKKVNLLRKEVGYK